MSGGNNNLAASLPMHGAASRKKQSTCLDKPRETNNQPVQLVQKQKKKEQSTFVAKARKNKTMAASPCKQKE